MKKNFNDIYYLGTIKLGSTKYSYYFNNNTCSLSRWVLTSRNHETVEKNLSMDQLPAVFVSLFDSHSGKVITE